MYCKNCKSEYRDGITVCPECNEILSDVNPEDEKRKAFNPLEVPKLLCVASNEFEADIIIAKLKSEGLYGYKKYRSTDSYGRIVLGTTVLGVEIMVAESDLEEAKEVIK